MKKLLRGVVVATVLGWLTKFVGRMWQRWSARPAGEIRATVDRVLPDSIDPDRRHDIADRVVTALKGPNGTDGDEPIAQKMATPPPPTPPVEAPATD
jgi:hypothetical protein